MLLDISDLEYFNIKIKGLCNLCHIHKESAINKIISETNVKIIRFGKHFEKVYCVQRTLWCVFEYVSEVELFQKRIGYVFSIEHFSWNDIETHQKFDKGWAYNAFTMQFR